MHELPIWFLIVSLFLPRIALFVEWLHDIPMPFDQPWSGFTWFFLPRILVLMLIYNDYGFTAWFWIHLVAAAWAMLISTISFNTSSKYWERPWQVQ